MKKKAGGGYAFDNGRNRHGNADQRDETKRFLENLGFIIGGEIMVVSTINGNLIVKVKDSRVAVSKEMAMKIIV